MRCVDTTFKRFSLKLGSHFKRYILQHFLLHSFYTMKTVLGVRVTEFTTGYQKPISSSEITCK